MNDLKGTSEEKTKKKKRPIDSNLRMSVWKKYFGLNGGGKCYCCSRPIFIDDFQVGHNKARAKNGTDHISNLRPICGPCNRAMGTMSIESYKKKYFSKGVPKKKDTKKVQASRKKPISIWDLTLEDL